MRCTWLTVRCLMNSPSLGSIFGGGADSSTAAPIRVLVRFYRQRFESGALTSVGRDLPYESDARQIAGPLASLFIRPCAGDLLSSGDGANLSRSDATTESRYQSSVAVSTATCA